MKPKFKSADGASFRIGKKFFLITNNRDEYENGSLLRPAKITECITKSVQRPSGLWTGYVEFSRTTSNRTTGRNGIGLSEEVFSSLDKALEYSITKNDLKIKELEKNLARYQRALKEITRANAALQRKRQNVK